MPRVEVTVPDKLLSEVDRLVEGGEFVNQEEAMEALLGAGISAMAGPSSADEEPAASPFSQVVDDQQDPAMRGDPDDEDYTF
ncbi:MAG: ribbon-helix-helix domain-containing protein [Halobacteriales archaeon]|nr:ribbon-helix-helix domain-containing protein [Halobacteriales archaeon]